jgi:hypothetical protein
MSKSKDTLVSAYQAMQAVIKKHSLDSIEFWGWDYSGRGMMGDITPAFNGDWDEIGTLATLAGKAMGTRASTDNYAFDGIVYFTGLSVSRKELTAEDWEALEAINDKGSDE